MQLKNSPLVSSSQRKINENVDIPLEHITKPVQVIDDYSDGLMTIDKKKKKLITKENVSNCCRIFITFLISRVGLLIVMIGYVCLGGLIFQELEAENERLSILRGEEKIQQLVDKIYGQIVFSSVDLDDQEFGDFLSNEIGIFRDFVTNSTVNGTLISSNTYLWDYFGAVFYAVTLVTTIGYGHITCKTRNGKIFTIVYSAIGIPLMMLFLANVGSSTATVFKFIYLKIDSCRHRYAIRRFSKKLFKNFKHLENNQELDEEGISVLPPDPKIAKKLKKIEEILNKQKPQIEPTKSIPNKTDDDETNIYDSIAYAQYVQEKNKGTIDFPDYFSGSVLNTNLSLIGNGHVSPLASSFETVKENEKVSDAIKRIDDLIAVDDHVEKIEDTQIANDKKYLRTVNFKEALKNNVEVNDDGTTNTDHLIVNPMDIIDTQIIEQPEIPVETKKKQFFKSFSLKLKNSKKQENNRNLLDGIDEESNTTDRLRRSSSEPKLTQSVNKNSKLKKTKVKKKPEKQRRSVSLHVKKNRKIPRRFSIDTNTLIRDAITRNASVKYQNSSMKRSQQLSNQDSTNYLNKSDLKLIYSELHQKNENKISVPFFLTLIIIPIYLVCGMFIFSSFENWNKLDAFYFCFVTVATIGFGDLIPGSSISASSSKMRISISALYILIGLVLLAMCLNLIKDQMKSKVTEFARKIGLTQC